MLSILLISISIIILTILSARDLRLGIYWVILTLPLYEIRASFGQLPTTLVEIHLVILALWWCVHIFRSDSAPSLIHSVSRAYNTFPRTWRIFCILWLGVATIALFPSSDIRGALGSWKAYFLEPLLFVGIILTTLQKKDMPDLLSTLLLSGCGVAGIGIFQKITGVGIPNMFWQHPDTRRVTSVFPFPNAVGLFLAPIAIIALTYAVEYLKKTSGTLSRTLLQPTILSGAAFSLCTIAIIFARSRGALLGMFIGIVFLAILHTGRRTIYWGGILITLGIGFFFQDFFLSNISPLPSLDSNGIRIAQWRDTILFLKDHPIVGAGLSGYQTAIIPYHSLPAVEIFKFPHTILLNFWTELGILGLVLFCIIVFHIYRTGFALLKTTPATSQERVMLLSILAALTTLLGHGLVDVPYFKNDLSVFFWVCVAILIILQNPDTKRAQ